MISVGKGKVYPRKGYESPEGTRALALLFLYLTSSLDGGVWSAPLLGRFTLGKAPVSIV